MFLNNQLCTILAVTVYSIGILHCIISYRTATMCILLFQWTVAIDLSNVSVGEIKLQKNGNLIKLPNGCVDVTVQCDQYTLKLNS